MFCPPESEATFPPGPPVPRRRERERAPRALQPPPHDRTAGGALPAGLALAFLY